MGYRRLNLPRLGCAILIGISLSLLMNRNTWSQEAIAPNIQPYIDQLNDDNPSNDKEAIQKIKKTNDIDGLIIILNRGQLRDSQAAIKVLGEIGPSAKKAVQPLIKVLQDDQKDVKSRWFAARTLGQIGSEAKAAVKPLIQELKTNQYQPIVFYSIHALMQISPTEPETVEAVIYTLENYDDDDVRLRATSAIASAIEKIESSERLNKTLVKLKKLTNKTNNWQVRLGAAHSLGSSGRDVKLAVETLINLLQETDEEVLKKSLESLKKIANLLPSRAPLLISQERKDAISGLETVLKFFQDNQDKFSKIEEINQLEVDLKNTLTIIKKTTPNLPFEIIVNLIATHRTISILLFVLFLWFLSISFLFLINPIQLLRINNFLQRYTDIPLPEILGGIKISLLRKFLFDIHYHPRVLDEWVKLKIDKANHEFEKKPTVEQRKVHIRIPVDIGKKSISQLTGKDLQRNFAEQKECILIYGEGGSGKTSLACQIAHWAMSNIPEERLCKHQMLPILLEEELNFEVKKGKKVFLEAIRGALRDLVDEEDTLSEELLEQLLRKRRLLVIVDRFSEMSETTRNQIRPELPDFPVNALVVTSRRDESLGSVNKTTIKLKPIEGNRLSDFMDTYLVHRGKRDLFDNQEFFEGCSKLSAMAGNSHMTVMLAKLYAEQMIAVKTNEILDDLPSNIPDIMLYYLSGLNNIAENHLDNPSVHRDAKVVAWECIRQKYQPGRATRNIVIAQLAQLGGDEPEARLKYLEYRLGIIKTIKPEENEIRYSLDPLAEYLASLYLVDTYQDNGNLWRDFLTQVHTLSGQPNSSVGFLKALHECCLAKKDKVQIPDFFLEELVSIIDYLDADYS
ncbi:MAG: PBS lyase [Trichodesmium sp. ALOHA_ZT_67]|nr:PBS lyase [Trichodesmium sp. ALOHA_ZT_67]